MASYTCEHCGGVFERTTGDSEMEEEFRDNFPHEKVEDLAIICDECYNSFRIWFRGLCCD